MGLHLPPRATLKGQPVSRIQKIMRKTFSPSGGFGDEEQEDLFDLRRISRLEPEAQSTIFSLVETGFAEVRDKDNKKDPFLRLTKPGEALMTARLRNRVPLARADKAFDELKAGVDRLNKDDLLRVSELWVFGSYMRRERDIGDIDAAILTERRLSYQEIRGTIMEAYEGEPWVNAARRRYGGASVEEAYAKHTIFGPRKKPIFDGTHLGEFNLRAGMPCQRIYTAENGWRAEDPIAMHPCATKPLDKPHVQVEIDQGVFSSRNEGPAGQQSDGDRDKRVREAAARRATRRQTPQNNGLDRDARRPARDL